MIVIVDDSALFRLNIRATIEKQFDVEIVECDTVRSMKEKLTGTPASDILLVILDLNLPDGNGLAAMEKIIAAKRGEKIPFIIVSKEINRALIPMAKKCGAGDILAKPINPDELVKTLTALYPDKFIALEKRDKTVQEYSVLIRDELEKAQKEDYPLALFIIAVTLGSGYAETVVRGRQSLAANQPKVTLKTRLSAGEKGTILPISDVQCLILMPYIAGNEVEATKTYFRDLLENAGVIDPENSMIMASAVYPDHGANVMELITALEEDLAKQHGERHDKQEV